MAEFTNTVLGKRLNAASGASVGSGTGANAGPMTIATLGDSQGSATYLGGAIFYAMQRYYPCDAIYDFRSFASGGQDFAAGGSTINGTSPRGFSLQATVDYPTRPADIAFVNAGYNDVASGIGALTQYFAGVEAIFAAGTQYVVLLAPPPRGNANQDEWHRKIESYARRRANCFYIDTQTYWGNVADIAVGNDYNELPATGAIGAVISDGTHPSTYAQGLLAYPISQVLRQIVREKLPRLMSPVGNYNPATNPWANILGPGVANNMGTAGLLGNSLNTGVAGISASDRITISDNAFVTPSIVVDPNTGKRKQRITLSGAASSGTLQITLQQNAVTDATGGVAGRRYEGETVLQLTGVKNVSEIVARWTQNNGAGGSVNVDVPAAYAFNGTYNERTERLVLRTPYPLLVSGDAGDPRLTVVITVENTGEAHGGTIDHEHSVMQIVDV